MFFKILEKYNFIDVHLLKYNKDLFQVLSFSSSPCVLMSCWPILAAHRDGRRGDTGMSLTFNQLCNWIMIMLKWLCQVTPGESGGWLSVLWASVWSSELLRLVCCELMEGHCPLTSFDVPHTLRQIALSSADIQGVRPATPPSTVDHTGLSC